MKLVAIICYVALSTFAGAQTAYTASRLYTFPASNTGPRGVAVDSRGNIYAAGNFSVAPNAAGIAQIIPPTSTGVNGSAVLFAGGTLLGSLDGTGPSAQFDTPTAMATDADGNIYVVDMNRSSARVRKVTPRGVVSTLSGLNGNPEVFGRATGVAVGPSGAIYITSAGGAGSNLWQYVPGGAPIALDATFTRPLLLFYGITVDSAGALYVTGFNAAALLAQRQLSVHKITATALSQLYAFPNSTDLGTQSTFPIAVTGTGNVFVGWDKSLYVLSGQSTPAQIATFGSPIVALAADAAGRIYVAANPPEIPVNGGPGEISVVAPSGVSPLPPQPASTAGASSTHLINIATRAFVAGAGSNVIAGFVLSGEGNQTVLIRGVGPGLAQFAVPTVLAQPVLTLFNSAGAQLAANTGWGANATTTAAQFTAAFARVGAFALPAGSADSALLVSLAPGNYTAQLSGVNGGTGNGLIEVYEIASP